MWEKGAKVKKKFDYKSYNSFADNPTGSDDDRIGALFYMTFSSRF